MGAWLRRHVGLSEVPENCGCKAPSSRGVTSDPEDFDGCTAPSSRGITWDPEVCDEVQDTWLVVCLCVVLFSLPLLRNHEPIIFFSALHEFP